jgi:hypothetical protein
MIDGRSFQGKRFFKSSERLSIDCYSLAAVQIFSL